MHPLLLDLGPLKIHWYGACVALALLAYMFTLRRLGRDTGRSPDYISNLLIVIVLSAVVGSRMAYVLEHWSEHYAADPLSVFNITQGGHVFYGGLLLSGAAIVLFARIHRERLLGLFDFLVTALPLAHAIGRVGCFLEGCCYGRQCGDSALGVTYPPHSHAWSQQLHDGLISHADPTLPLYPTQLFEAAALLALFAILMATWRRRVCRAFASPPSRRHEGVQLALYLALYAAARFILETFRSDTRLLVGPLTIGQAISLALLALAAALAFYIYNARPRSSLVIRNSRDE